MKKTIMILAIFLSVGIRFSYSQGKVINQVVAVIGSKMIMLSDIEDQYAQYVLQGYKKNDTTFKCALLEDLMFQKLLLNQADLDSVTVTDAQVESDLDTRIAYFSKQLGGEEALIKYHNGKSLIEIKAMYRDVVKNMLVQKNMEEKITENIKVTPSEVKKYYSTIPKDSIPTISSELEVGQIVKLPKTSDAEKAKAKEKLEGIRARILKGEDFATLAVLYSEDAATSTKGGEIGLTARGVLDPTFEAAAFKLKVGEVSPVIQSAYGYHIIQGVERRGDMVNVRHILIMTKVAPEDMLKAKQFLDTVYSKLKADSITFEKAAAKYSDDASKINGGIMVNVATGSSKFQPDELSSATFFIVDKMKVGDFSQPVPMKTDEGKQGYRILYLKSRSEPHLANIKDDYDYIQTCFF